MARGESAEMFPWRTQLSSGVNLQDDTSIRRGDIVEWRKVRLAKLDGSGYSDLGAPDHTAIIVQTYLSADVSAAREARDGQSLPPWAVGSSR